MFVFVPAGQAGTLARQFAERGLDKSGIKLIGTGDIVDDDDLAGTGDTFLGVVTAGFYSAAHSSGDQQDLCRRLRAGDRSPCELYFCWRL